MRDTRGPLKIETRAIKRRPCGARFAKPGTREIALERILARTAPGPTNGDNRQPTAKKLPTLIYDRDHCLRER